MKKIKVIVVLIVFAVVASTVWQVASCAIANYELKDDLKEMASMGGARGLLSAASFERDLGARFASRDSRGGCPYVGIAGFRGLGKFPFATKF